MAQAIPRSDRGDVRRGRSRAADHRPRHRLQAVHRRPDPVDGDERDAAGLSPAQGGARARATSRGNGSSTRPARWSGSSTWDDPAAIRPLRRAILSPRLLGSAAASASRCGARRAPCAACSRPVLDEYAVGFRVMHGFSSATSVYDVAQDDDGRPLIVLYVGDYDPSGMFMSEADLPDRLAEYGGDHVDAASASRSPTIRLRGPAVVPGSR